MDPKRIKTPFLGRLRDEIEEAFQGVLELCKLGVLNMYVFSK